MLATIQADADTVLKLAEDLETRHHSCQCGTGPHCVQCNDRMPCWAQLLAREAKSAAQTAKRRLPR